MRSPSVTGPPGLPPNYVLGDLDTCQVNVPQAVTVINHTVYISTERDRGDNAQHHFLTLSYGELLT